MGEERRGESEKSGQVSRHKRQRHFTSPVSGRAAPESFCSLFDVDSDTILSPPAAAWPAMNKFCRNSTFERVQPLPT